MDRGFDLQHSRLGFADWQLPLSIFVSPLRTTKRNGEKDEIKLIFMGCNFLVSTFDVEWMPAKPKPPLSHIVYTLKVYLLI